MLALHRKLTTGSQVLLDVVQDQCWRLTPNMPIKPNPLARCYLPRNLLPRQEYPLLAF